MVSAISHAARSPDAPAGGDLARTGAAMAALAAGFLVALAGMVVLTVVGDPPGEGAGERLAALAAGSAAYQWGFVLASLTSPLLVASLLLAVWRRRRLGAATVVGCAFLVAYLPLVVFAYVSQYTVFPRLLAVDPAAAEPWWFGAEASIPYAADLAGYALFGVGALVLAATLVRGPGLWRWLAWALAGSGVTSVAGFVGLAAGVGWLELGSVVGGVLTVPVAALLLVEGLRDARTGGARHPLQAMDAHGGGYH